MQCPLTICSALSYEGHSKSLSTDTVTQLAKKYLNHIWLLLHNVLRLKYTWYIAILQSSDLIVENILILVFHAVNNL